MKFISEELEEINESFDEPIYINREKGIMITIGISCTDKYYFKYFKGDVPMNPDRCCRISMTYPEYIGNDNNYKLSDEEKEELIDILYSISDDYQDGSVWMNLIDQMNIYHKYHVAEAIYGLYDDSYIPLSDPFVTGDILDIPDYIKLP